MPLVKPGFCVRGSGKNNEFIVALGAITIAIDRKDTALKTGTK